MESILIRVVRKPPRPFALFAGGCAGAMLTRRVMARPAAVAAHLLKPGVRTLAF